MQPACVDATREPHRPVAQHHHARGTDVPGPVPVPVEGNVISVNRYIATTDVGSMTIDFWICKTFNAAILTSVRWWDQAAAGPTPNRVALTAGGK
jgi:hypothetical protein